MLKHCFRYLAVILAVVLTASVALSSCARAGGVPEGDAVATGTRVPVYIFYSTTCPHCTKALQFLQRFAQREDRMRLVPLVLAGDARHDAAFIALSQTHKIEPPAVPLILIGDGVFVGYGEDATTGAELEAKVAACLAASCPDPTGALLSRHGLAGAPSAEPGAQSSGIKRPPLPETVWVPLAGEVELRTLSLPILTVLLGAIDGFNPCAMWVLVFLIGLLMGMRDPFRMWTYGAVFLVTSGLVYFAFMAAWLNLFLFLGALAWIRIAIGILAVAAGVWYLAEFWRNPDAVCKITTPGSRQRIMDRMRSAVAEPSFGVAVLALMTLAVGVNMIELLCSAGIPAVYTQMLSLSALSPAAHYGYLALYILVFMLDDALVFVTAMLTLRQTGLVGAYARYSHLIGGGILLVVGGLMLFRPEWLAFT